MRIISIVVQTKHAQRNKVVSTTNRRIHKSAAVSETSLKLPAIPDLGLGSRSGQAKPYIKCWITGRKKKPRI